MEEMNRLVLLVVDDDAAVRRAMVRILQRDTRLRIIEAEDGLAALRVLESGPVDIVISDEVMPEINGVRLLETVRARWPGTRRVLYTGHPDADIVLAAINRGGVDKALTKGSSIDQLRFEIGELVDETLGATLGRPDTAPPPESGTGIASVPPDGRRPGVLLVAAEPAVREAYAAALTEGGCDVRAVHRADEGIETLRQSAADVVVVDLSRPEIDATAFLHDLRGFDLDCPVIVTAPRAVVTNALHAIRDGAYRYLVHPVRSDALCSVVRQAAVLRRLAELRRSALPEASEQAAWQVGDRASLEVRFRQALEKLFMVYQPIVSWAERRVIGYEALVRSAEPALPHPGALFDAATRLDRLDELNQSIRLLAPRPFATHPDTDQLLFLNVHVTELGTADFLDGLLEGMASRVVLEVTERAALDAIDGASSHLTELRARGFRIAVDDLGAGYAGLSSFALLEPDIVKIDMSLVRNVHLSPLKRRLIAGLGEACADLKVGMVAEGVETVEERDALVEIGCDLFQGYLFARPGQPFPEPTWG